MNATAVSRIVNIKGNNLITKNVLLLIFIRKFLNNDISKWPARMFAVNRTHKVIGRIIFLVNSINTIKFIKNTGVPCGTKWIKMCLVFFIKPKKIVLIQNVNAIIKVSVICEELAKFCGNKAVLFTNKINMKIETVMRVLPFLFIKINLASWFILLKMPFIACKLLVVAFLNVIIIINKTNKDKILVALSAAEDGSNMEKRLFIIFSFFY